jgi:hypothetical protein
LYFAFIKAGLEMVKPGGFMLYVLPHSFLLSPNAEYLRGKIAETCWVRFLCDLSQISVFGEANSYPILLIVQKKPAEEQPLKVAYVVRCTAYPGHALESALENRAAENGDYSIYPTSQSTFEKPTWQALSPSEHRLQERIFRFPFLENFFSVSQGFNTAMDSVFIRHRSDVPDDELAAYAPYLPDRMMGRYQVPASTGHLVFYPVDGGRLLSESEIRARFPKTWAYLEDHETSIKTERTFKPLHQNLWVNSRSGSLPS